MAPEEIFVKAITSGMSFYDDGHIDCRKFACRLCTLYELGNCNYNRANRDLRKQNISLREECAKLLPLYREQHPELFI